MVWDFFEVRGRTGRYIVEADYENNFYFCTCPGWMFRKTCSHIRYVKEVIGVPISAEDIIAGRKNIRYFDSSIDILNEMFDGPPYSSGELFGIYGAYKSGKTLFSTQESFYRLSKGNNVLYMDTEGSIFNMIKKWGPVFKARFGIDDASGLLVEDVRSLRSLLWYLGYDMKIVSKIGRPKEDEPIVIDKKKSPKIEVSAVRYGDGPIEKIVRDNNIDFVILDSISNPFRSVFPTEQQNNPSKSFVEAAILQRLVELQRDYDIGVIITIQASWNEADMYSGITQVRTRGGFSVNYNVKRLVYLNSRDKEGVRSYRKFWLVRAEDAEPWSKVGVMKITDMGYVSVPITEWKDVFTNSELKLINIRFDD